MALVPGVTTRRNGGDEVLALLRAGRSWRRGGRAGAGARRWAEVRTGARALEGFGRTAIPAVAAFGLAAFGLGYCSSQFGLGTSEEGRGTDSDLLFPASELETTLAVLAVHNSIELRVTHDIEVFGERRSIYTDVYPAEVPGSSSCASRTCPTSTWTRVRAPAVATGCG